MITEKGRIMGQLQLTLRQRIAKSDKGLVAWIYYFMQQAKYLKKFNAAGANQAPIHTAYIEEMRGTSEYHRQQSKDTSNLNPNPKGDYAEPFHGFDLISSLQKLDQIREEETRERKGFEAFLKEEVIPSLEKCIPESERLTKKHTQIIERYREQNDIFTQQ